MSKSDPSGCVFVDDSPSDIQKKIKSAVTATEGGQKSPGEKNLMMLLAHFGKQNEIAHFSDQQTLGTLKFSELKETLAKDMAEYFGEFREKKKELLARPAYLAQVLGDGASRARQVAGQTLLEVKQKIGLL
jgi:tryptophanyl-tRNA synthetase